MKDFVRGWLHEVDIPSGAFGGISLDTADDKQAMLDFAAKYINSIVQGQNPHWRADDIADLSPEDLFTFLEGLGNLLNREVLGSRYAENPEARDIGGPFYVNRRLFLQKMVDAISRT